MLPAGPIVMLRPPAVAFTVMVAEGAAAGVGFAVAASAGPLEDGVAAAEAGVTASEDVPGVSADRVGDDPRADEDWVDEQPTTATAAKTAQTAAILTLF
jgi:hypothetical protein